MAFMIQVVLSDVALKLGRETWVTDIPVFVQNLKIELQADIDLYLKLYNYSDATGFNCNDVLNFPRVDERVTCIAGYDCVHAVASNFNYNVI